MDKETVISALDTAGLKVTKETRTGNEHGFRLELENGTIVNVYDSGKVVVQGNNPGLARRALMIGAPTPAEQAGKDLSDCDADGSLSGHPVSSRNKLAEGFVKALADDFLANGAVVIERVRDEHPDEYLKILAEMACVSDDN